MQKLELDVSLHRRFMARESRNTWAEGLAVRVSRGRWEPDIRPANVIHQDERSRKQYATFGTLWRSGSDIYRLPSLAHLASLLIYSIIVVNLFVQEYLPHQLFPNHRIAMTYHSQSKLLLISHQHFPLACASPCGQCWNGSCLYPISSNQWIWDLLANNAAPIEWTGASPHLS